MLWHKIQGAHRGTPSDDFLFRDGSDASATVFTFSSKPLGTPHSSRHIVVGCGANQNTTQTLTVTVGGVSATEVVKTNPANWYAQYLFIAAVPTGATGDIVVTSSSSNPNMGVAAWALYDLISAAPTDTAAAINSSSLNVNCNVTSPGVAVLYASAGKSTSTITGLTGVTADFSNTVFDTSTYASHSAGFATGLATETPRTLTATFSTQGNRERAVAATWQKN